MTTIRRISLHARAELFNGHISLCSSYSRRSFSKKIIQENDIVLLKQKGSSRNVPVLTKPLRPGEKIFTGRYAIATEDIIGKGVRDLVTSKKGIEYRIHEPSLAEYTDLSPRLVTPIYSQDANLIVSLLDLHPSTPDANNGLGHDRLEIFEAGTGHGALTLNLARAIHGANTAAPAIPEELLPKEEDSESINVGLEAKAAKETYVTWRANRKAVIHTLDRSAPYSMHAQMTVRNFRRRLYFPHVDFHIGTIENYLLGRLTETSEPFLDHAILDLPNTSDYFDIIARSMKPNGSLITWSPSITQINKCVMLVREKKLPFLLEKVLELGAALGVGGREWDVRLVRPKDLVKAEQKARAQDGEESKGQESLAESSNECENPEASVAPDTGLEMVCRPKVGVRVVGGGFVGLWRRMEAY